MTMDLNQQNSMFEKDPPKPRNNGNGATRDGMSSPSPAADSPECRGDGINEPDTLKLLLGQLAEFCEYASMYASARIDGARASARNAVVSMAVAALGSLAAIGVFVVASWFALSGMAQGLGSLFGDRHWMGPLLTGLLGLATVGVGLKYAVHKHMNNVGKRTAAKYEERQASQRTRFGRDAHGTKSTPDAKCD